MAVQVYGTYIQFNDGTTQSTAAGAGVSKYYSGDLTIPSSLYSSHSVVHGLGQTPKFVQMVAYCHTATWGFSVGQQACFLANGAQNGNQQSPGWWADSTYIYYMTGSAWCIFRPDNQYNQQLVGYSGNFYLRIYAWA